MKESKPIQNVTEQPERLLRIKQVLEIIPVSRSGWWAGVKEGRFPQPIKLSKRVTCWRESSVRALAEGR